MVDIKHDKVVLDVQGLKTMNDKGQEALKGISFSIHEGEILGTTAAIFSWDSTSSYGLPGAEVDRITCWSEIQKGELIGGADWLPDNVNVGGMPPYDGYVRRQWVLDREEYFKVHGLDPNRRLLSYASSFVNLSPNIQNIQALVNLVNSDRLNSPSQLLIRLHPIHMGGHFVEEADQISQIANEYPHIHVVQPILPGIPDG